MKRDRLATRIESLIERGTDNLITPFETFQGALSVAHAMYGDDSSQEKALRQVVGSFDARTTPFRDLTLDFLRNAGDDLKAGMFGTLRAQVTGGVLADFILLAREALSEQNEGSNNVAAVLAAAAYEDTIRRMGRDLAAVTDRPNLSDVLEALRKKKVLEESQFSLAQGYLQFRNRALHADWKKLERESIASALAFVENLILRHFT